MVTWSEGQSFDMFPTPSGHVELNPADTIRRAEIEVVIWWRMNHLMVVLILCLVVLSSTLEIRAFLFGRLAVHSKGGPSYLASPA